MPENTIGWEPTSPEMDRNMSRFVLAKYRESWQPDEHLAACPEATVSYDGYTGQYGCDTGCEYARLEAEISCPHGVSRDYTYGEFGEIADIIDEIDEFVSMESP